MCWGTGGSRCRCRRLYALGRNGSRMRRACGTFRVRRTRRAIRARCRARGSTRCWSRCSFAYGSRRWSSARLGFLRGIPFHIVTILSHKKLLSFPTSDSTLAGAENRIRNCTYEIETMHWGAGQGKSGLAGEGRPSETCGGMSALVARGQVQWTRIKRSSVTPSHLITLSLPRIHCGASVDCLHSVSMAACSLERGGSVAAYSRKRATSCGSSGISRFKACSKRPRLFSTSSQHSRWRHRYAPRPAFLPVASAST